MLDPTVPPRELGPERLEVTCSIVTATDGLNPTRPEVPLQAEPAHRTHHPLRDMGNRSPGAIRVWIPACRT